MPIVFVQARLPGAEHVLRIGVPDQTGARQRAHVTLDGRKCGARFARGDGDKVVRYLPATRRPIQRDRGSPGTLTSGAAAAATDFGHTINAEGA